MRYVFLVQRSFSVSQGSPWEVMAYEVITETEKCVVVRSNRTTSGKRIMSKHRFDGLLFFSKESAIRACLHGISVDIAKLSDKLDYHKQFLTPKSITIKEVTGGV